jgi:Fur family ferric uptake transcriptional regulator
VAAAPDWDARLRAVGLRSTGQRRAVLEALGRLRHATVDELAAEVQRTIPEVSLSTVYRTLEVLDEVGLVTHAHLHHGSPTYHTVDGEPHIHLVCQTCGAVEQQSVEIALGLADTVRGAGGFRVDLSHLVLHGRCAACTGHPTSDHAAPDHGPSDHPTTEDPAFHHATADPHRDVMGSPGAPRTLPST